MPALAARAVALITLLALAVGLVSLEPAGATGRRVDPGLRYGPAAHQLLDLYRPSTPGPHPLLVFAHGGGWVGGTRADIGEDILAAVDGGWAVASVSYALATETTGSWPANVHDFKRATRWLRSEAGRYGLNPDVVVAAGYSAGGHLALIAGASGARTLNPASLPAALAAQRGDYQGVVTLAGVANLARFHDGGGWGRLFSASLLGCGGNCTAAQIAGANPLTHLTEWAPPVYAVHGVGDDVVPYAVVEDLRAAYQRVVPAPVGGAQLWVETVSDDHLLEPRAVNPERLAAFLAGVASGRYARTGRFADVYDASWYAGAVAWAFDRGVTTGVGGANRFAPVRSVTRAEALTMLWRAVGEPASSAVLPFVDVDPGAWYAPALRWAYETKVARGDGTSFFPTRPITRGEMATLQWRAAGRPGPAAASPFVDVPPGAFYADAVAWAYEMGITQGVDDRPAFAPRRSITRGETATLLFRADQRGV